MHLQKDDILKRLEEDLIIRPLLDIEQIGQLTIDFRLGTDFLVSFQGRDPFINASYQLSNSQPVKNFFASTRRKIGQEILLHPHQTVLCSTLEYVKLPNNVYAILNMRSSFSRLGLTISTIVLPGYCGCISLEITNTNNNLIKMAVGSRIVQARLFQIERDAKYTYGLRKYVAQVRPEPSGITKDEDLEILRSINN
ncbi:MAG: dCTP deaminase [Bacteroidetes bacterium]|nr:MAG: dCTP deaminase [Bacteroidota bacterium]